MRRSIVLAAMVEELTECMGFRLAVMLHCSGPARAVGDARALSHGWPFRVVCPAGGDVSGAGGVHGSHDARRAHRARCTATLVCFCTCCRRHCWQGLCAFMLHYERSALLVAIAVVLLADSRNSSSRAFPPRRTARLGGLRRAVRRVFTRRALVFAQGMSTGLRRVAKCRLCWRHCRRSRRRRGRGTQRAWRRCATLLVLDMRHAAWRFSMRGQKLTGVGVGGGLRSCGLRGTAASGPAGCLQHAARTCISPRQTVSPSSTGPSLAGISGRAGV